MTSKTTESCLNLQINTNNIKYLFMLIRKLERKFHTLPHLIYTSHLSRVSAHMRPSEIPWEVGLFRRHPKRRVKHVMNDIKIISVFDSFLVQTLLT